MAVTRVTAILKIKALNLEPDNRNWKTRCQFLLYARININNEDWCNAHELLGWPSYPVWYVDHIRSPWYIGCGRDLLASCYSHRKHNDLRSDTDCPDAARSSGNCWQFPAKSGLVSTPPCREAIRRQLPNRSRLDQWGRVDRSTPLGYSLGKACLVRLVCLVHFLIFVAK